MAEPSEDRAARRRRRRRRHGARDHRHAARTRDRQLHVDRDRRSRRDRDRRAAVVGAAHRGAAADGAVARVRRPRRGARRHGEVHDLVPARRADALPHRRDRPRDHPRLPDVHRQPDGGRQAPGDRADAPDHLSEPEPRQPGAAGDRDRRRRLSHHRPVHCRGRSRSSSCCRSSSACC